MEIEVYYTATWSTSLEVPDDFEVTVESLTDLIDKEHDGGEFNFNDGGADWWLSSANVGDEVFDLS